MEDLVAIPKYTQNQFDLVRWRIARLEGLLGQLEGLLGQLEYLGAEIPPMPVDSEKHLMAAINLAGFLVWREKRLRAAASPTPGPGAGPARYNRR